MILKFEDGRLGNQLFQYFSLSAVKYQNELLVLVGFSDLFKLFDGIEAKRIPLPSRFPWLKLRLEIFFKKLYSFLKFINAISTIDQDPEQLLVPNRHGNRNLTVANVNSYFTSEKAIHLNNRFPELQSKLQIKSIYALEANNYLDELGKGNTKVFIHVRRGDFATWPSPESPALLPDKWYFDSIDLMVQIYSNPIFVVLTDDYEYCSNLFSEIPNVLFPLKSDMVEFAIMSQADAGILSPSTFSWWASKLNPNKGGVFIAPKYWAGYNSKIWFPVEEESSFLHYLD